MKKDKTMLIIKKGIIYAIGMIMIGFGIVLLFHTELGNSAWDSLNFSISKAIGITIGQANIIVAGSCTIFVTVVNKNLRYLYIGIPIVVVGLLIDLFDLYILLNEYYPEGWLQIASFIAGLVIVPYGASLLVISTFPAGVYEELTLVMMRFFKTKNFGKIRVIMEFLVVALAVLIGYSFGFGRGSVNIGTVIISFTLGPILHLSLKINKPLIPLD